MIELCPESSLLAVVTDDFLIHIYDIDTHICVRRFKGHCANITDLTFTGDARWLVSASGDSTLRVWDIPTGQCINWLRLKSPISTLSISPRGDFLATCHIDSCGIFLWSNKNFFSDMFLRPVTSSKPIDIDLPNIESMYDDGHDTTMENKQDPDTLDDEHYLQEFVITEDTKNDQPPENIVDDDDDDDVDDHRLGEELISFSKAPSSKWKTLVKLDQIIERNKPTNAPEVPKSLPYLLPTLSGITPRFVTTSEDKTDSQNISIIPNTTSTPWVSLLRHEIQKEESKENHCPLYHFSNATKMLANMTPSAIDFEIRSLGTHDNYFDFQVILTFILDQLDRKLSYEMVQSLLNIFLRIHTNVISDAIHSNSTIAHLITQLQQLHQKQWHGLEALFHNNLCLITLFSNLQL